MDYHIKAVNWISELRKVLINYSDTMRVPKAEMVQYIYVSTCITHTLCSNSQTLPICKSSKAIVEIKINIKVQA